MTLSAKQVTSDQGYLWPTAQQEQLLRACLLEGNEALKAFDEWARSVNINALDYGSLRLLPLLYRNLIRIKAETVFLDMFRGAYRQTHYQNKLAFHRGLALLKTLNAVGIDTLILKGAAMIAFYYREAGVRPISDFDVLIRPEQAQLATTLLLRNGWIPRQDVVRFTTGFFSVHYSWHFSLPAAAELDLHWFVFDQCCYPNADTELWAAAVTGTVEGQAVRSLNATDQLLHTCVHGAEWNLVPPLRWIADAMTILRSGNSIDWNRLIGEAKRRHLILAARDTLSYLRRAFDAAVPDHVLQELGNVTVSRKDVSEYYSRTSPPGNFPALWKIYFAYLRHRTLFSEFGLRPLSLPRYLQARWGTSNLLALPVIGARLLAQSARNRFSPPDYGAIHQAGRAASMAANGSGA